MARSTVSVNIADSPVVKAAILAAYEQGWDDGYNQGRDDESEGLPLRERADVVTTPVHGLPPGDSGLMPCCGRTPFEVPVTDRMTHIAALVTCTEATP